MLRRNEVFALSLRAPAQTPDGRQLEASIPGAQSQLLLVSGQSSTVGTWSPAWGTPILWKRPSENSGVLWQSMQEAFPTNRRAPFSACGEIQPDPGPSCAKRSNGVSRRAASVYS